MSFEAESSAKRGPRRLASARSELSEDDDSEILSPVFASAQGEQSLAGGDESDEEEDEEPTWKKDRIGKLIDQVAAKAHDGHGLHEVRSPAPCASRCPCLPDVLLRCSGGSEGVAQGGASTPARAAFCTGLRSRERRCVLVSPSLVRCAVHLGRDPGQRALLQASGSAERRAAVLRARRRAVRGRAAVCHLAVRGLDGCARQRLLWRRSSLQAAPRHVLSPRHFQRRSCFRPRSRSCGLPRLAAKLPRVQLASTPDSRSNHAAAIFSGRDGRGSSPQQKSWTQCASTERRFLNRAGDGRVRSKDKSIVQSLRAASASPSPRPRPRPARG